MLRRYRLAGLVGRGAMGSVWRARDELLERDAVKQFGGRQRPRSWMPVEKEI